MARHPQQNLGESQDDDLNQQYWEWVDQMTMQELGGLPEDQGHGPMPCGECGQCTDCLANIHQ